MPRYGFLAETPLDFAHIQEDMNVLAIEGVPYSPDMIAKAKADIKSQLSPDDPSVADLAEALPEGGRSCEQRRRRPDRTGRPGRLSPDARHDG